ncbi:GLPGLI family protein [Pseudotenacibaculum sp. MALMAid0570]|uniref:GLPGLI family protein n=1 Tax=Pseudotenacibaculum sp. MALMAid0570 TaxID=3143938 RepID=UPI0032DFD31D
MKPLYLKLVAISSLILVSFQPSSNQDFVGQAYYFSKSKMELGNWGARLSQAQKNQIQNRLKNRLEKTFVLSFNQKESMFIEEEKLDAVSGATDSWGGNFTRGDQYKNVRENSLVQSQEFYGKRFLVKDKLYTIDWKMGSDSKQIGQYTCYKATAMVPVFELNWYNFSWSDIRRPSENKEEKTKEKEVKMIAVEAWYTLDIPVSHGPGEFWGLPGLILEVSAGNTTMLCSKIVLNPKKAITIVAPKKGKEINKKDYQTTIRRKMVEMRNNRFSRSRSRRSR